MPRICLLEEQLAISYFCECLRKLGSTTAFCAPGAEFLANRTEIETGDYCETFIWEDMAGSGGEASCFWLRDWLRVSCGEEAEKEENAGSEERHRVGGCVLEGVRRWRTGLK